MSQGANPCSSSAVAVDSFLKSYKDIRQQQKDIFHALNWCLGGCMEEWEWSLSLCEYSLKVLRREPHFLILFCCIKMVTVAMFLLCLPLAVCGAVHRPAVLILQSRGIQRTAIESVVHISLLYSSVYQPPGRGPVPGPGISYSGPREVLLEFVILVS